MKNRLTHYSPVLLKYTPWKSLHWKKKKTMSWENIPASFMPPQDAIRVLLNNGTDERKKKY